MGEAEPRRIRQGRTTIERILNRLDAAPPTPAQDARSDERFKYRLWAADVRFEGPAGGSERHLAPTRNISRRGASFLVGNYIHAGTPCMIRLITVDRKSHVVTGKVRHCFYFPGSGSVHIVGVAFDEEIDVNHFQKAVETLPVLVIDHDATAAQRMRKRLEPIVARVSLAKRAAVGLQMMLDLKPELIFISLDSPSIDACETANALRRLGYDGLVVGIGESISSDLRERCTKAGFSQVVGPEFDAQEYKAMLSDGSKEEREPEAEDQSVEEVMIKLETFLTDLPDRFDRLSKALADNNLKSFQSMLSGFHAASQNCGINVFSELAQGLNDAVNAGIGVDRLRMQVAELALLCQSTMRDSFGSDEPGAPGDQPPSSGSDPSAS
jgi:CheY-like chemotaxis protein